MRISKALPVGGAMLLCGLLVGCGSSSTGQRSSGSSGVSGAGGAVGSALAAEAQSKATGDIPDSQVFLSFRDRQAGYSLAYPEGWAQRGSGDDVTFQEKNNLIHVVVTRGSAPTPASVASELQRETRGAPSLTHGGTSRLAVQGAPVLKVSYSTIGAPNAVTGKRVQLLVDRYVYARAGKIAVLDLGTARGVDNVDAYRMISRSFRWL